MMGEQLRATGARRVPRIGGTLAIRSSLALLRDPLDFLVKSHERHGNVFRVQAATRQFVVLAGQSANRFAGATGREALESRTFWGRLAEYRDCPHLILAEDGDPHRTQRKHYGDVLSKHIVDHRRAGCDEIVQRTFKADRDGLLHVQDQTRLLIARLVHHCLTGGAALVPEQTTRSLLEVFRWETNTLLLGKWPRWLLRAPSYRRHYARAEAYISELVRSERNASESELGGWFERVRQGKERYPELFSSGDHRMALLLPFVAGVDTVGSTLGFVLASICADEALLSQVRAEISEAFAAAHGAPEAEALRACPTLFGCVMECLRMYPAAFSIYRGATRDFEFEGAQVAQGEDVVLFTSATHFDARYFPEPRRFDPQRYRAPRSEHRQKHVFMPYGAGPHVCLGASMGEAMLLLASASILQHHRLRAANHRPVRHTFDPSLSVHPSVRLRMD